MLSQQPIQTSKKHLQLSNHFPRPAVTLNSRKSRVQPKDSLIMRSSHDEITPRAEGILESKFSQIFFLIIFIYFTYQLQFPIPPLLMFPSPSPTSLLPHHPLLLCLHSESVMTLKGANKARLVEAGPSSSLFN